MRRLADGLSAAGPGDHEINHSRKRTTMRKLIESTLVSLDGVIEAPERWVSARGAEPADRSPVRRASGRCRDQGVDTDGGAAAASGNIGVVGAGA
jgi:hypothetical protein